MLAGAHRTVALNQACCIVGTCFGARVVANVVISTGLGTATVCVNQTLRHGAVGGELTDVPLAGLQTLTDELTIRQFADVAWSCLIFFRHGCLVIILALNKGIAFIPLGARAGWGVVPYMALSIVATNSRALTSITGVDALSLGAGQMRRAVTVHSTLGSTGFPGGSGVRACVWADTLTHTSPLQRDCSQSTRVGITGVDVLLLQTTAEVIGVSDIGREAGADGPVILDITSCVRATGSGAGVVTSVVPTTGQIFVTVIVDQTFWLTAACGGVSNVPFFTGTLAVLAVPGYCCLLLGFCSPGISTARIAPAVVTTSSIETLVGGGVTRGV